MQYRDGIEFPQEIRQAALTRQHRRCALCGKSISSGVGHHVIPAQTRGKNQEAADDAFMKSEDNCVMLHFDCHYEAHGNGQWGEAVIDPKYFEFSHASAGDHQAWLTDMNQRCKKLYSTIMRERS